MQCLLNFWLLPVMASVRFQVGCPSALAASTAWAATAVSCAPDKAAVAHSLKHTKHVLCESLSTAFQASCMFPVHVCCKCCSRFKVGKPACDWECHLSTASQFVLTACATVRCCCACTDCRPCWNCFLSVSQPPHVIMTTGSPGSIEQDNLHTVCITIGRPWG